MKKTVAVIDDDKNLLEMIKQVLEDEGYRVKTYSHTVFIDVLEKETYDLLLLDVWFDTYKAGIAMAQAVNNRAKLMNKPVVLMSSDPNIAEYAQHAGVTNYLSKPLNFEALLEVLESLFARASASRLSQETATYNQSPEPI